MQYAVVSPKIPKRSASLSWAELEKLAGPLIFTDDRIINGLRPYGGRCTASSFLRLRLGVRDAHTVCSGRLAGACNPFARLRLFGQPESAVRMTLYRDNHSWCPYCHKV